MPTLLSPLLCLTLPYDRPITVLPLTPGPTLPQSLLQRTICLPLLSDMSFARRYKSDAERNELPYAMMDNLNHPVGQLHA